MRTRNLYDPLSAQPYRFSRSKVELFLSCPRCLYLDRRLGIERPDGPPFSLNGAVDILMKKEFDYHRLQGEPHPLMTMYGVDAIPLRDPRLDEWRDALRGVTHLHAKTNFVFFGAVDDLWLGEDGSIHVVDYKATSTPATITLEGPWKAAYKRQLEMYQWLLRRNGLKVSVRGYFVFVNADKSRAAFGGRLEFTSQILAHDGDDSWVEDALLAAHACLQESTPPQYAEACEWCLYRRDARQAEARLPGEPAAGAIGQAF